MNSNQKLQFDDGSVLKTPDGEKVRVAQLDGMPNNEIKLHFLDREGSPHETRDYDDVVQTAEEEGWEFVTGGAVPGHIWGKAQGKVNCPKCGKFIGVARNLSRCHVNQTFYPELYCDKPNCDGHLTYEELKQENAWIDLENL